MLHITLSHYAIKGQPSRPIGLLFTQVARPTSQRAG